MLHFMRMVIAGAALGALFAAAPASAVTLPVLSMSDGGSAAVGVQFNSASLSTLGPQSASVSFDGFLGGLSDIPLATFTLTGLTRSGSALQSDLLMLQRFTGGTCEVLLPDNTLLLSGRLSNSILHGTVGLADGMLYTTTFSEVTGGTLARRFNRDSLVLQMHLSAINDGAGVSTLPVTPPPSVALQPFTALATVDILGEPVPEPASMAAWAVGGLLGLLAGWRRRRRSPIRRLR